MTLQVLELLQPRLRRGIRGIRSLLVVELVELLLQRAGVGGVRVVVPVLRSSLPGPSLRVPSLGVLLHQRSRGFVVVVPVPCCGLHLRRFRAPVRPRGRDDRALRRGRLREVIAAGPRLRVAVIVRPPLVPPLLATTTPLVLLLLRQRNPSVLLLHVDELLAEPSWSRPGVHGAHLVPFLVRRRGWPFLLLLLVAADGVRIDQ